MNLEIRKRRIAAQRAVGDRLRCGEKILTEAVFSTTKAFMIRFNLFLTGNISFSVVDFRNICDK